MHAYTECSTVILLLNKFSIGIFISTLLGRRRRLVMEYALYACDFQKMLKIMDDS